MTASLAKRLLDPAYFTHPEYVQTYGPEVADLAALAGFPPDPEQELALDALFAIDEAGAPLVFEFAVIAPRQNLKTGLFKQAVLGWLFITEQRLIVWSAHDMTPTKEAFLDLTNLIEECGPLRKRLAPGPANGIYRGNGDESIELATGQRVLFKARTHKGSRGLTGDKVILDEAFALLPVHIGALLPTLAARPHSQVAYGSSAGSAGSEILRDIRDRGRKGEPSLAYMEYGAPEGGCADGNCSHARDVEGCALDDRKNWQIANSALGRRITVAKMAAFRRSEPPAEFAREHMGWWEKPAIEVAGPITEQMWRGLRDPDSTPTDPVAFALHISRDRSTAAIGVAARRADGRIHVGVIPAKKGGTTDTLPGVRWIPGRLRELRDQWSPCAFVVDGHSAAASLIPAINAPVLEEVNGIDRIIEEGVEVITTNASDMARACGNFYDAVIDDQIRHKGADALAKAVAAARKRDLSGAWAWDSNSPQLYAVTLALHGLIVHGPKQDVETEVWGFWE